MLMNFLIYAATTTFRLFGCVVLRCLVWVCFSTWKFVTQVQLKCSIKDWIDLYLARSFCVFFSATLKFFSHNSLELSKLSCQSGKTMLFEYTCLVKRNQHRIGENWLQPLSVNSFSFAVVDFLSFDDEKLFLLSLINFISLLYKWKSFFYFYTENFLCKSKSTYILSLMSSFCVLAVFSYNFTIFFTLYKCSLTHNFHTMKWLFTVIFKLCSFM